MENKKVQIWLPLLLSISMSAGIFIGYKMKAGMPGKSFFYLEKRRPLQEIMDLIENKYVDKVNLNLLADTGITAMLAKLDPHSLFIPAEEVDAINEEIRGSFFGIGIEFNIFDDTLNVINVLEEGPGDKAGVKTGDKILKAGNILIAGKKMKTDSIRRLLRGEKGTSINISLLRGIKRLNVMIIRDVIPISSIDASYMIDTAIGYIRINKFSTQTYREFMKSLEDLKARHLKKLVLDLRGNGGGVLDDAIEIADEFLDGDKLITYTEGKHFPRKEYRCRREGQFEKGDLVVLADEGTASASEILIGALQDWDRATVIGRRTFGKGLVQEQYDLSDKSALRLTIARYYTPTGRSIQRSYANGGKAYYEEIGKRLRERNNAFDSLAVPTAKEYKTQAGKSVYAGIGIEPDYIVPLDTGNFGSLAIRVYTKGLINDFGYKYYLANQSSVERYKSAQEFATSFRFAEIEWKLFETMALKDSIDLTHISLAEKNLLVKALKSAVARQVWRNEGYYEVNNVEDNAVKKALELLLHK